MTSRAALEGTRLLKWTFVAPTLVFLIALNVFPLFYNIILSFTNADLSRPSYSFVGGRNYSRIFTDPGYAESIRTTGLFVFFAVSVELLLGFALAVELKQHVVSKTVEQPILIILTSNACQGSELEG